MTDSNSSWFAQPRADVLAGAVVALALIPEAIAFSIIAGVDPAVGLFASFCIAVVTAFAGGRPAMISAATGAMALVVVPLVREHGLPYLLAATLLTGVIQIAFGYLRLARYMRFVPRAVMTGFVNSLAILIFMAQLPQVQGQGWLTFAMIGAGLVIIYGLPRITRAVPSPMVAIVVLTALTWTFGWQVRTVGDLGALPHGLPVLAWPDVPMSLETLRIIAPYSFALALVGLIESLLTAKIVDDATDTPSDKHREAKGQGVANIVAGLFGGMAGCAMIGQSVINVKSGGRGRLSTLVAGVFLLVLVVGLGDLVARIPMPALVAVMVMVSLSTFDWSSIPRLSVMPRSEAIVLVVTVAVVVTTHDLSKGVIVGVLLSALFFARVVGKLVRVERVSAHEAGLCTYRVQGQLFFVSVEDFVSAIGIDDDHERVVLDLSAAHIWDDSAVQAVDRVVLGLRELGVHVELRGMNEASASLVSRLAVHDKPGASLAPH
ncbi:MAG: SulP family inorganic anion transporter [Deltaproteobacteria bacterium]|nr:SulP family inorganic anion transporter [Deltaproteobacteria bacterium]